jgi:spore germination protein YaaH
MVIGKSRSRAVWILAAFALVLITAGAVAAQDRPASGTACEFAVPEGWLTYTVAPNDTLYGIAARYQTTTRLLARANCLADPARLRVGQVLVVPGIANQYRFEYAPNAAYSSGGSGDRLQDQARDQLRDQTQDRLRDQTCDQNCEPNSLRQNHHGQGHA